MSQLDIFDNSVPQKSSNDGTDGLTVLENGEYVFIPNFFSNPESDILLNNLRNSITWRQESMNMYGKKIDFPRLTAWYGNIDKPYTFSGITMKPILWTSDILKIKSRIEPIAKTEFNSVMLNLYRNGNDSISWHSDSEKELGTNPIIASVNFGATRKFQLRHVKTKEKIDIDLSHGSLLIMQGQLQHFWQHQVPKTNKIVGERINLTFRVMK